MNDKDKQFDEDLQKLKSVDYETQEVVFEGSEEQFDKGLQKLKSVDDEIQDFRFEGLLDSPAEKLAAAFNGAASDLYAIVHDIVERWSQSLILLSDLSNDISLRTPDVIKKRAEACQESYGD